MPQLWRSAKRRSADAVSVLLRPLMPILVWVVEHSRQLMLLLGAVVAVSGFVGLWIRDANAANPEPAIHRVWEILYQVDQIFVLEYDSRGEENAWLAVSRTCAALLVMVGAAKVIATINRETFDYVKLSVLDHHVVICGIGRIGMPLARDLMDQHDVVIIEQQDDHPHVRECRRLGAIVLFADATQPETLRRVHIGRAAELFAVTGNDAANAEIVANVCDLLLERKRSPDTLRCHLHVADAKLVGPLEEYPLFAEAAGRVTLNVFNVFDHTASLLLRNYLSAARPVVDEVGQTIVFGFGQMGQSLAVHAAQLAHYENRRRLRMTFIDRGIEPLREEFCSRFPRFCGQPGGPIVRPVGPWDGWNNKSARPKSAYHVGPAEAIEYAVNAEFLDLPPDVEDDELIDGLVARLNQPGVAGEIVVCFDDDPHENAVTALRLQNRLAGRLQQSLAIYIWLPDQKGLGRLSHAALARQVGPVGPTGPAARTNLQSESNQPQVQSGGPDLPIDLVRFGERETVYNYNEITKELIRSVARRFHDVYCELVGGGEPWEELPSTFRRANLRAAQHLMIKLRMAGLLTHDDEGRPHLTVRDFTDEEVELLSEIEHYRWTAERLMEGWGYGRERDNQAMRRPNIVTWELLESMPGEQEKDRQMVRLLPRILQDERLRELIETAAK